MNLEILPLLFFFTNESANSSPSQITLLILKFCVFSILAELCITRSLIKFHVTSPVEVKSNQQLKTHYKNERFVCSKEETSSKLRFYLIDRSKIQFEYFFTSSIRFVSSSIIFFQKNKSLNFRVFFH